MESLQILDLRRLAGMGYYGQPVLSLYIYLIFLYHVNQCRVQLGTNKVVVVELLLLLQAFDIDRHYTHG